MDSIIQASVVGIAGSVTTEIIKFLKENYFPKSENNDLFFEDMQLLENEIAKRLVSLDLKNLATSVPRYVLQPTLQAWRYSIKNPEVNNLFANLLCSAFLQHNQTLVHPAFIEIIKQLHPKELVFLKSLYTIKTLPILFIKLGEFVKQNVFIGGQPTSESMNRSIPSLLLDTFIANPFEINSVEIYVDNLCRLGLLVKEDAFGNLAISEEKYNNLLSANLTKYESLKSDYEKNKLKILHLKGFLRLSAFGEKFYSICVDPQYIPLECE